jgi:hypothetical protein
MRSCSIIGTRRTRERSGSECTRPVGSAGEKL